MLKVRNKRIHTEYSKQSSTRPLLQAKPVPLPAKSKRKSSLSHDRQTYITRTLNSINHEVKYDALTIEQIEAEKYQLKGKVKEMNAMINSLVTHELEKKVGESRISRKATIGQDMGIDLYSLSREAQLNENKIATLQDELSENNLKLAGLSNVEAKLDSGKRIAEIQIKIKELKEQLGRIKKNKLLREKEIMKGNIKQNEQIHQLQLEYFNLTRKTEFIASRLQAVQEELADSEFSLEKQRTSYEEVKIEYSVFDEIEGKLETEQEELSLQYNSRKRKLQLLTRKGEKDQEAKKKKYYNLLLEYQEKKSREKQIEQKIKHTQSKNESTLLSLSKLLEYLRSLTLSKPARKSLHNYQITRNEDENLFEVTHQQREYESQRAESNLSYSNNRLVQNQLNKVNANRSFIRKWNLEGSIVHQHLPQSPSSHLESINQVQSDEQAESNNHTKIGTAKQAHRYYRKSNLSKQIKHFKTQNSQQTEQQEEYLQDFQA